MNAAAPYCGLYERSGKPKPPTHADLFVALGLPPGPPPAEGAGSALTAARATLASFVAGARQGWW